MEIGKEIIISNSKGIIEEAENTLNYLLEDMRVGTSEYYDLEQLIILAKQLTTPAIWVKKGNYPFYFWECSNCNNYVSFESDRSKFCNECGFPMIKEEEKNE